MDESVIKHLEQPQVGTLKLSEAIREGSKLRGECRGTWLTVDERSCAWTAAAEATGMKILEGGLYGSRIYTHLKVLFPTLSAEIFCEVVERMDHKNWSRLRCADWLDEQGY